jgi:hypothetical protein
MPIPADGPPSVVEQNDDDGFEFQPPVSGSSPPQPPPALPAEPGPVSPPGGASIPATIGAFALRLIRADFQRLAPTPDEAAALSALPQPVTTEPAQRYLVWRRALLWVSGGALALSGLIGLFEGVDTALDDANPTALAVLIIIYALAAPTAAALLITAAVRWRDIRRSRLMARIGWSVLFFTPFILATIPWASMVDAPGPARATLGAVLGMILTAMLAPALLALPAGMLRAALSLKTLVPGSVMPGWIVVAAAPLYTLVLIALTPVLLQAGGAVVTLGIWALIAAPLVYVYKWRDLARPHADSEVASVVARIRFAASIAAGVGAVMVIGGLLDANVQGLDGGTLIGLAISFGGAYFSLSVVAADFLLGVLHHARRQSAEFEGSPYAVEADRVLGGLAQCGLAASFARSAGDGPGDTDAGPSS